MNRKPIFLSVGIINLIVSYILFTTQQYFSLPALVGIFILITIGLLLLLLPYYLELKINKKYMFTLIAISIISIALMMFESYYDLVYSKLPQTASIYIITVPIAALIFCLGMYLIKKYTENLKSYKLYILIFVLLIFISIPIYLIQSYNIHATQWKGTDEIAFNYYASYLLLHGINPYNSTMASVLSTNHLIPTYELNNTCECSFDYPALGFLLLAPLSLFKNFLSTYVLVGIIVSALVGFLLYKKSKFGNYALLPITVWFAAVFYFIAPAATLTSIIAVSLFLLIAYIYRSKIILSGVLIGLAVSIHQLAWFVAPFFYIIILKEAGKKSMLKSILITALIFILANGYFIAISPHKTLDNIFSLFLTKLQFEGPSLIQLLVDFYPAAYWSLTLILIIVFISSLVLFYFYNDTLRPLLAITPIMILFLSWRSTPAYTLIFIPLLIGLYIFDRSEKSKDLISNKRLIVYSLILILLFVICIIIYAHFEYTKSNALEITSIKYDTSKNLTTGTTIVSNIRINLANNENRPEPIGFYLISRNPDYVFYTVDNQMPILSANSNYTYIFPTSQLQFNSNSTKIEIFVLDNDNIISARVK